MGIALLQKLIDYLSDILFPPNCLFCGKYLGIGFRPLICEECMDKYSAYRGKCCRCDSKFVLKNKLPHCNTCQSARHPFNGVISTFYYSGGVKRAVIEHKFDFTHNNAPLFGSQMSSMLEMFFVDSRPDLITFVPSTKNRLHERGYDAIWEIAEEVSFRTGIPLEDNALKKVKDIPQQSKTKSRLARMRNVRGCFSITDKSRVKGKAVVLIDDVYTTGATTRECAKVLKRAGAAYIIIAVVAISESFRREQDDNSIYA